MEIRRIVYLLVGCPLLVEFLGEVALLANDLGREFLRVKGELDAQLGVEVDERVHDAFLALDRILPANLCHHSNASIW